MRVACSTALDDATKKKEEKKNQTKTERI